MRQAAVMLIIKDGRILGISRRYDKTKFGLIGGKCDDGETTIQAALREVLEETRIVVKKCTYIYSRKEPPDQNGEWFECDCFYAEE